MTEKTITYIYFKNKSISPTPPKKKPGEMYVAKT